MTTCTTRMTTIKEGIDHAEAVAEKSAVNNRGLGDRGDHLAALPLFAESAVVGSRRIRISLNFLQKVLAI